MKNINVLIVDDHPFIILGYKNGLKLYPKKKFEFTTSEATDCKTGYKIRLSQQRADAVRQYLIRQGIAESRLTSRGYGETHPIETNATNEGRGLNRRVEFVRTDARAGQR